MIGYTKFMIENFQEISDYIDKNNLNEKYKTNFQQNLKQKILNLKKNMINSQ